MHLEDHLRIGIAAVDHVRGKLVLGAANRNPKNRKPGAVGAVMSVRAATQDWCIEAIGRCRGMITTRELRHVAETAKSERAGNCKEQTSVAIQFLLETTKAEPIEFFALAKHADHAFAVIGRDLDSEVWDVANWGPTAVICDPWNNEVYRPTVHEMTMRMPVSMSGFSVRLIERWGAWRT